MARSHNMDKEIMVHLEYIKKSIDRHSEKFDRISQQIDDINKRIDTAEGGVMMFKWLAGSSLVAGFLALIRSFAK